MRSKKLQAQFILIECEQILKDGGGFWDDVNGGYLPEDLVLAAKGVYESVPKQDCKDVGKTLLDLIRVDTERSLDPAHNKMRSRLCARECKNKEARQNSKSLIWFSVVLCNATTCSCEGTCLNHDVCWLISQMETNEVETQRHHQGAFPRNSPETRICPSSSGRSTEIWRGQCWQVDQAHVRNSSCFPHLAI